ncbi:Oidioi.mRNA.OKI2018_I69.PAR.g12266.t1.cds [Oikopleura dioica]|nr:Oidioi.mRNA.OKI2018_I69.PAR.g12266.t1.cds [Oikopleura dioica]
MEFPQDMGSDWRKESTSSSASNGSGNDSRPNKHNPEYPKGQSRTIYLPAERTGAVIGKNGRMKHLIKEVCNVWMSIKSEPFEHDVTKRVCVIRGPTVDNLDHAESLIKELLRERETTEKSIALNTSDDVGRVIGSGGSNIQVIKDKTGAFVYVDKENVPAQYAGKCIIRGNSVQVQAAEKRVLELLARRDNLLEQVGLHRNMQQAPQASLPIHKPTGSAHNYNETIGNNSGYSGMKPDHNGNYFDSAKTNDDTKIGVWNSSSPDTTWNSRETERELVKQSKKRIQDNILIPLNAVGMVIGKKGKNIKIIQETSGANVYIDKEYTGHTDSNALCVICGKSEQVEIAKEMIYEKLNQYNTSNSFPILDPQGSIIGTPPSDARSDGSSGLNYHSPLSRSFNRQLQLQQPSPTHQQQRSYPNQESLSPRYQNHAAIMNSHPNMAMSNAMPQPPPPIKTPEEPHSPDELGLNKLSLNILDNNNDSSNSSWLDSDAFIKTDMFLPPPTRGHQLFDMDTKEWIIK